jgi:hypothetical protein
MDYPVARPARLTAISRASTTSSVRMCSAIAQPTIRRLNRSCTAARYSLPSSVSICLISAAHNPVRGVRAEVAIDEILGRSDARHADRRAPPPPALVRALKASGAHQPLDTLAPNPDALTASSACTRSEP